MKKLLKIIILIAVIFGMCGCTKDVTNEEENSEEMVELVTVERFMEIYNLTQEDVGDFNLEAMIFDLRLTEEELNSYDWGQMMKRDIKNGKVYGYNIKVLIRKDRRFATKDDDIMSTKYIIMRNGVHSYGDFFDTQTIVIEIDNGKSYYTDRRSVVESNYSESDIIKELDDEIIEDILTSLEECDIPSWKSSPGIRDKDKYYYNLYIVLENGDVLFYDGTGPDGKNKGFDEWYEKVLGYIK